MVNNRVCGKLLAGSSRPADPKSTKEPDLPAESDGSTPVSVKTIKTVKAVDLWCLRRPGCCMGFAGVRVDSSFRLFPVADLPSPAGLDLTAAPPTETQPAPATRETAGGWFRDMASPSASAGVADAMTRKEYFRFSIMPELYDVLELKSPTMHFSSSDM